MPSVINVRLPLLLTLSLLCMGVSCSAWAEVPNLSAPEETSITAETEQHEVWAVMSGASLKGTIEGWARITGWTVVWDNPVDYRLRASATFPGLFEEAVARLVDAVHQGSPELTVTLYRGNRVIHVEDAARLRN